MTLFAVRIEAGAIELKVTDYRENNNYCGYVRCILGKCRVTDMLSQISEILEQIKEYNTDVSALTNRVEELTVKVDEMTGDVIAVGECGENINYVCFSDGRVILKGTGEMYDYNNSENKSPFYNSDDVKSVVISEGITAVGEFAFNYCNNLKKVTLPSTLTKIGRNGFMPHIDQYVFHQNLYGLTTLNIPNNVTEIAKFSFYGTAIQTLSVPSSVVTVGEQVFGECQNLTAARYGGKVISDRMFVRCVKLKSFTITKSCKEIAGGCFNYCTVLTDITFEGTVSEWNAVTKRTNWDNTVDGHILKVNCIDGYFEWNTSNKTWNEVKTND